MAADHHLAQLNIGRLIHPLDAPETIGFVEALEPVNALADAAHGFIWRLQTEEGDATSVRAFDDEMVIVNLSVWDSLESLREFVFAGGHLAVMRQRQRWFERPAEAHLVLWWVPAGHIPTLDEAKDRLERLRRDGPGPDAFTFRRAFGVAGEPVTPRSSVECDG